MRKHYRLVPLLLWPFAVYGQTPAQPQSGIVFAAQYPGSDLCAKVMAAEAALPSGSGTIDARELRGPQACALGMTLGKVNNGGSSPAPVRLLLGNVSLKTSAPIQIGTASSIIGMGQDSESPPAWFGSQIHCSHAGNACVSLVGASYAKLEDLLIFGDRTSTPKTGLLLGRLSVASAQMNTVRNVSIQGYFSLAALYDVASELDNFDRLLVRLMGGGAKYPVYFSPSDSLLLGGLVGSTLTTLWIDHSWIWSDVTGPGTACFFGNLNSSTANWDVLDTYLTKAGGGGGAYVELEVGGGDGSSTAGPIEFNGIAGEPTGGPNLPEYAFYIHGALSPILNNLRITNTGNIQSHSYYVYIPNDGGRVELDSALIDGSPSRPSQFWNLRKSIINHRGGGAAVSITGLDADNIIFTDNPVKISGIEYGSLVWENGTGANFTGPVRTMPTNVTKLAVCDSETDGELRAVTDSKTSVLGALIESGGTNHVLAYCDGAGWTVAAR